VKKCVCGNPVANNARVCPNCGHRFTHPFVKFLAWFFGISFAIGIISSGSSNSKSFETGFQDNSAKMNVASNASTTQEGVQDQAQLVFATLGAISLRKAMRNPDSFVLEEAHVMHDNSVCFVYRAQNGFGGMDREYAVLSAKGTMSTSDSAWNHLCAHKKGYDKTTEINRLISEHAK